MGTKARNFKLFVTPGVLRWNRWSGQLIPAIDAYGVGLPPLIFAETWQYAINDLTTANTGGIWTTTQNPHTTPYAQMGNPAGQVNLALSGFAGFCNHLVFVRSVVAQRADKGRPWAARVVVSALTPGTVGDFGQGNSLTVTLGTQNGFTLQNSVASGVQLLHIAGGVTTATVNVGVIPSYNATITIKVNGASSKLYIGGSVVSSLTITPEVAGFTNLQCDAETVNGNAVGTGMVMQTMSLYGTHG